MGLSFEDLDSMYSIKMLLNDLNLKNVEENSSYFKFFSPFRDEKTPSTILFKKNLFCIDFGSGYRASLFKLVKDLTGQTLYSLTNIDPKIFSSNVFNNSLTTRKETFPERRKSIKIEGELLSVYSNEEALEYCRSRYITNDFIENFNIQYSKFCKINGTIFSKRLCIPVFEKEKRISMEGRDITRKQKTKVLYPKGGSVSTLFNIDKLNKKKPLVVVEGIMDMPKIWKHITKNVTTTFGILITNKQKELLLEFDDIILFPDGDEAGLRMISEFDEFYDKEFRIAYIEGTDPGDAFLKDISKVIENPINSTDYFLEKSELFETNKKINFFQ